MLPAMMTSLALPDLKVLRVDLYPRVTLPDLITSFGGDQLFFFSYAQDKEENELTRARQRTYRQARVDSFGILLLYWGHRCAFKILWS